MSFEEVKAKFKTVWEQIKGGVSKICEGEAAWLKMKGIRSEQEIAKKQKTSEEVPKEITRLGGSSASYQFFVDMLKQIDRDDLNKLWALVKETLSVRPATDEKEMELWVELKRLDEDLEIFMLVEKNYPLRKALALVMICYKLQVENYSQMATNLVRKIQQIAGTKMPSEYQQDYKKTRTYAPKIYNDPNMPESLRDMYSTLESRYDHEERTIDPSFYNYLSDDSVSKFTAIDFDCLLSLDEQICHTFIFEFYKTLKLERDSNNNFSIQFVINNHNFNLSLSQLSSLPISLIKAYVSTSMHEVLMNLRKP
nr:leucine-rich repeat protein [Tanacetum cinerariifolium]